MYRHYWRACDRRAGFSFVELLVTIIIAGIAFAVMVPLFVQAVGKTSDDNMRNLALNLAQDKIERVRSLSFSVLTNANLQGNTTKVDQQFGTPLGSQRLSPVTNTLVAVNRDVNGGRQFLINYQVVDAAGTTTLTAYKTIRVTVWWEGNPRPLKPVVLSTMVYGQYAGPQLLAPLVIAPAPGPNDWITSQGIAALTASATVNAAQAGNTWGVKFVVTDTSGAVKPVTLVSTKVSDTQWSGTWPITGLPDGHYFITATAYALNEDGSAGMPGNTLAREIRLERQPPGPVAFAPYAGDACVNVSWTAVANEGVVQYRIYRSTTPGGQTATPYVTVTGGSNVYKDTGVANGTTYYYKIIAVDFNGNALALNDPSVVEHPATPNTAGGTTPSPVIITSAFSTANSVPLIWSASKEADVVGYFVYRDHEAQPVQFVPQTGAPTWTDTSLSWNTTYTYTVKPLASTGREGPKATIQPSSKIPVDSDGCAQVTLPVTPMYTLWVGIRQSPLRPHTAVAHRTDANGVIIETYPATGTLPISEGMASFGANALPFGVYKVILDPGTSKAQTLGVRLSGSPLDPVTVYFSL